MDLVPTTHMPKDSLCQGACHAACNHMRAFPVPPAATLLLDDDNTTDGSHVYPQRSFAEGASALSLYAGCNALTCPVQLLQEIEQKAAFSQQQMQIVKAQMASKNRETRMLQLTSAELDSLPQNANVYEGVGKM